MRERKRDIVRMIERKTDKKEVKRGGERNRKKVRGRETVRERREKENEGEGVMITCVKLNIFSDIFFTF